VVVRYEITRATMHLALGSILNAFGYRTRPHALGFGHITREISHGRSRRPAPRVRWRYDPPEVPMSAQPEEAPAPPAPAAAVRLLAQLRDDRRADTWVSAFERDWAKALEDFPVKSFCSVPERRKTAAG
jgi:hypothetical protein